MGTERRRCHAIRATARTTSSRRMFRVIPNGIWRRPPWRGRAARWGRSANRSRTVRVTAAATWRLCFTLSARTRLPARRGRPAPPRPPGPARRRPSGRPRPLGADDQVLDLPLAALLFVRALDNDARAAAAVGVLHLRAELAGAEIELGADAGRPQRRGHALVVGETIAVEHGDDDGAGFGTIRDDWAPDSLHGRRESRHADRQAGRRHQLAAKPAHKPVVAPATPNRTEYNRFTFFVGYVESQLRFENRPRVIFKSADNVGRKLHPSLIICGA